MIATAGVVCVVEGGLAYVLLINVLTLAIRFTILALMLALSCGPPKPGSWDALPQPTRLKTVD